MAQKNGEIGGLGDRGQNTQTLSNLEQVKKQLWQKYQLDRLNEGEEIYVLYRENKEGFCLAFSNGQVIDIEENALDARLTGWLTGRLEGMKEPKGILLRPKQIEPAANVTNVTQFENRTMQMLQSFVKETREAHALTMQKFDELVEKIQASVTSSNEIVAKKFDEGIDRLIGAFSLRSSVPADQRTTAVYHTPFPTQQHSQSQTLPFRQVERLSQQSPSPEIAADPTLDPSQQRQRPRVVVYGSRGFDSRKRVPLPPGDPDRIERMAIKGLLENRQLVLQKMRELSERDERQNREEGKISEEEVDWEAPVFHRTWPPRIPEDLMSMNIDMLGLSTPRHLRMTPTPFAKVGPTKVQTVNPLAMNAQIHAGKQTSDLSNAGENQCFLCGRLGHWRDDCKYSNSKVCFKCQSPNHRASDCNFEQNQSSGSQKRPSESNNEREVFEKRQRTSQTPDNNQVGQRDQRSFSASRGRGTGLVRRRSDYEDCRQGYEVEQYVDTYTYTEEVEYDNDYPYSYDPEGQFSGVWYQHR